MLHVTAGGFLLQHHTKWCSPDTMIATPKECSRAQTALDPKAPAVKSENYEGAPKGCSRHEGAWFFNTHEKGSLDGISEPVCKASTGKPPSSHPSHLSHMLHFELDKCLRYQQAYRAFGHHATKTTNRR